MKTWARNQPKTGFHCAVWLLIVSVLSFATSGAAQKANPATQARSEYSGMYSFLRDGEFVQVTVEDGGKVSGYVARYGDLESDKGVTLDHFFKTARLDGNRLSFVTEVVHGISFELEGTITRGIDKKYGEEGYYVIEGKLKEVSSDDSGKRSSRERGVSLKSLPRKLDNPSSTPVK